MNGTLGTLLSVSFVDTINFDVNCLCLPQHSVPDIPQENNEHFVIKTSNKSNNSKPSLFTPFCVNLSCIPMFQLNCVHHKISRSDTQMNVIVLFSTKATGTDSERQKNQVRSRVDSVCNE